ncbi:hypothetical protein, partial [Streptomyces hydrogenans]
MFKGPLTGSKVMVIPLRRLIEATNALVTHLPESDMKKLKVNSGEHLAAILATAYLGRTPVGVEPFDGPDLVYAQDGDDPAVAIEIKSLPGPFRQYAAESERHPDALLQIRVTAINDVMREHGLPKILQAAKQLEAKVPATLDFHVSKQVFLVSHPLDHVTMEALDNPYTIANVLDPLPELGDIEAVWLYLAPDHLVRWRPAEQEWMGAFCGTQPADDPKHVYELIDGYDPEMTLLQN